MMCLLLRDDPEDKDWTESDWTDVVVLKGFWKKNISDHDILLPAILIQGVKLDVE